MCNFAPNECIAVGKLDYMQEMISSWNIPGKVNYISLVADDPELDDVLFSGFGFVHVTNIPDGLELLVLSKLSAALGEAIGRHEAVVELNYLLPLSSHPMERHTKSLSPPARELAFKIRQGFNKQGFIPNPRPIAFIDSGVNLSQVQTLRDGGERYGYLPGAAYDYSNPGQVKSIDFGVDHDNIGHGTDVFRLLDTALRKDIPIVSGKITKQTTGITVLNLARSYAHLVAKEWPAIVNLSIAPRNDTFLCPNCNRIVSVHAFHSLILPFVFRLAARETVTVFAAGNSGQPCNARHFLGEVDSLFFAIALDSKGAVAKYSNFVDRSDNLTLSAFGGDSDDLLDGYGVFSEERNSRGTSFAAPFTSAAAYVAKMFQERGEIDNTSEAIATYCANLLETPFVFGGTRI